MSTVTIPSINEAMIDLHAKIAQAQTELEDAGMESARLRSDYRKAKAVAFTTIKAEASASGERMTNPEIESRVDIDCEQSRLDAYLAEAREYAAKQNHRRLLDVLSSWQTLAGMVKEESRFTRTGGDARAADLEVVR